MQAIKLTIRNNTDSYVSAEGKFPNQKLEGGGMAGGGFSIGLPAKQSMSRDYDECPAKILIAKGKDYIDVRGKKQQELIPDCAAHNVISIEVNETQTAEGFIASMEER